MHPRTNLRTIILRASGIAAIGAASVAAGAASAAMSVPSAQEPRIDDPPSRTGAPQRPEPSRPVHPVEGKVDYGDAIAAFGHARGRPHEGQDVFAPAGTPLLAPRKVVVLETGTDGGRGHWLALYHRGRDETYVYFHMIRPARVREGERLRAGARVGAVGCTGSCSGDHLHFEIRAGRGPYGEPRDPLPALKRWRRVD